MDSVIPIDMGRDYDPNKLTLEEATDRIEEEAEYSATQKLMALAGKTGDFSEAVSAVDLTRIGAEVVEDYETDKKDRKEWEDTVREALEAASQSGKGEAKTYPWPNASSVRFPILTTAALQYNARMYPAVVKGDEAVLCKVIGQDNGRPVMGPQGPAMQPGPDGQPQPVWIIPPGGKAKKARRVGEYLNTVLFYRMEDWETDTDMLLMQLPIVGCVFRKLWFDSALGQPRAALVPALRLYVPSGASSLETAPRITEELPDVYANVIDERVRAGRYRDIDLTGDKEADDKPRLLLEQHRLMDLDDDGLDEPYIVTVDHETHKVLRIEANFGPEDVKANEAGEVVSIKRGKFYIKYDLFPHPEGKFYGIGLGHLLKQLGDVIDTAINQLIDAGHAQTAGGGFIASGVRLQARGGGSVVSFRPGEYKTVDVPGNVLREAIVERTLPNVSPTTFQVLDLILGAARDISGAKDVITGEASNNGQVGTTLALIEQGLQVFNATAKRTFRSLKDEYTLLFALVGKHGGDGAAQDYQEVLDDPDADFAADFATRNMDIRPVSDPSSVTRMQKMAKSQYIIGTIPTLAGVGGDVREALRRGYEAADIEDIDKLLPPPVPQPPAPEDPRIEANVKALEARGMKDAAAADKMNAEAQGTDFDNKVRAFQAGAHLATVS